MELDLICQQMMRCSLPPSRDPEGVLGLSGARVLNGDFGRILTPNAARLSAVSAGRSGSRLARLRYSKLLCSPRSKPVAVELQSPSLRPLTDGCERTCVSAEW